MVIYLKKFIWIFLLVMVNKGRLLNKGKYWFVSFINRFMVLSKPLDNGTPIFLMSFSNMALSNPSLIILCLPKDLDLHLLFYWSIWMISASLVQTLKWSSLWKLFFILSLSSRIWDVLGIFLGLKLLNLPQVLYYLKGITHFNYLNILGILLVSLHLFLWILRLSSMLMMVLFFEMFYNTKGFSLILLLLSINLINFWLNLGYLTCKLFIIFCAILSPLLVKVFFIFIFFIFSFSSFIYLKAFSHAN